MARTLVLLTERNAPEAYAQTLLGLAGEQRLALRGEQGHILRGCGFSGGWRNYPSHVPGPLSCKPPLVIHLHLVCFASVLLPHLRLERGGAQDPRTRKKAADLSTAAAQDQLRGLFCEGVIIYLKEKAHGPPMIDELERLRFA